MMEARTSDPIPLRPNDIERAAVYRELLNLSDDEHTAMLIAAGEIPLERENGGIEYPPFKVFKAMLRAYAKTRGIIV